MGNWCGGGLKFYWEPLGGITGSFRVCPPYPLIRHLRFRCAPPPNPVSREYLPLCTKSALNRGNSPQKINDPNEVRDAFKRKRGGRGLAKGRGLRTEQRTELSDGRGRHGAMSALIGRWERAGFKPEEAWIEAEEAERAAQRGRERCGSGRQRPNGAGAGARGLVRGDAE